MTIENRPGMTEDALRGAQTAEPRIASDQVTSENVEQFLDQFRRAVGARTSDQIPVRRRPGMFN